MIDPTFKKINRLFVFSFKKGDNDHARDSFDKNYKSFVEIKDFNALIDNKPFLDQPVKNRQEVYKKFVEMSRNDDYTTENLSDYLYHQKYYKVIGIDFQVKQIIRLSFNK